MLVFSFPNAVRTPYSRPSQDCLWSAETPKTGLAGEIGTSVFLARLDRSATLASPRWGKAHIRFCTVFGGMTPLNQEGNGSTAAPMTKPIEKRLRKAPSIAA